MIKVFIIKPQTRIGWYVRIGKDESGRTKREGRIGQDETGGTNREGTIQHITGLTLELSLHVNPASFARPFQSFRVRPATHTIEYDASLTGMGVVVWRGGLVGPPRVLMGFAVLPSPFMATMDSSFQNTYEYLAILLGLLLTKSLGLRDGVFAVLGDSRSSLAWVL